MKAIYGNYCPRCGTIREGESACGCGEPHEAELKSKLGEVSAELAATKMVKVTCEEHSWGGDDNCPYCRLDDALQRLADIRHAMEHAEEIGRMDHYAANTIKQALAVERQLP